MVSKFGYTSQTSEDKLQKPKKKIYIYIYIYIHIHFRLEGGRVERLLSSPHLTGIPKLQLASQWYSGKESACQWWRNKRCGFDPWIGRPPGEGSRNPLQYSCLGNSMDRGAWRVQSLGSQSIGHDWACVHTHTKNYYGSKRLSEHKNTHTTMCCYGSETEGT